MVDFFLSHYYLINIFIIAILFILICKSKHLLYDLFYVFVYFSLHYAYGLIPVFKNDFKLVFDAQKSEPHLLTNILAMLFIVISTVIMGYKYRNKIKSSLALDRLTLLSTFIISVFSVWAVLLIYYLLTYYNIYHFKLLIIGFYTFIITSIGYLVASTSTSRKPLNVDSNLLLMDGLVKYSFVLLLLITAGQLVEFISGRAWICCIVFRPSSFLFNPNNLGFWLVTACAFFLYTYVNEIRPRLSLYAYILLAVNMFLISSRSFFLLLFLFHGLILFGTLVYKNGGFIKKTKLIAIYYCIFAICCVLPELLGENMSNHIHIKRLQVDATRIIYTPAIIYQYLTNDSTYVRKLKKMTVVVPGINNDRTYNEGGVNNVSGRLSSDATDNAYTVSLKQVGKLTTLLLVILLCLPLCLLFNRKLLKSSALFFLLSYYFIALSSGIAINVFTVFPPWAIISATYAIIISYAAYISNKAQGLNIYNQVKQVT